MPKRAELTRDQLIRAVREASVKEELAIPLYDSHISAALFWSGLPKDVQEKVVAGLKVLTTESRGHVKLLKRVEAIVRAGAKQKKNV